MGREVAGEIDHTQVRLAELVAALSLGIDLGFGQPMEHVLRQCLIALRLAEGLGLDEDQRAVVYYTALLINVGCHTDAHEQAKWFGDDIAVKSIKYDHDPKSLRMAATGMRFLGSGHPPLHRFRLGLEFALSGHREVDDMVAHHAAIARTMAEQLSLPDEVVAAIGWPGELEGEGVPLACRVAQVAEFIEVANWEECGARSSSPVSGAAGTSTRRWPTCWRPRPTSSSRVSTPSGSGMPSSTPSRRSR